MLEPGYHAVSSGSWGDAARVLERVGDKAGKVSGPQIPKGLKVQLRTFNRRDGVI